MQDSLGRRSASSPYGSYRRPPSRGRYSTGRYSTGTGRRSHRSASTPPRQKTPCCTRSRARCALIVVLLLVALGLAGVLVWNFTYQPLVVDFDGLVHYDGASQSFILRNLSKYEVLRGTLGADLGPEPYTCSAGDACFQWPDRASLVLRHRVLEEENVHCTNVTWQALSAEEDGWRPVDCFMVDSAHWYGGPEMYQQRWPINNGSGVLQPYITNDFRLRNFPPDTPAENFTAYGNVAERFFFSSKGVAIVVDDVTPLHVSINQSGDGKLCLMANYTSDYPGYPSPGGRRPVLQYTVCSGRNALDIHEHMYSRFYGRLNAVPDTRMLEFPVWSTYARYGPNISENTVGEFAFQIFDYNLTGSNMFIDDSWEGKYGDLTFNRSAFEFPDPSNLIRYLHQKGLEVSMWVTPFINTDSAAFRESVENGYLVRTDPNSPSLDTPVPALVRWWRGVAGLLDVTNPDARRWYLSRLHFLRENLTVDSFNFDAGEARYFPDIPYYTHEPMINPSVYSSKWVEMVSSLGVQTAVRTGYRTQSFSVYLRMMEKRSSWGGDNGLRTVIPTMLLFGVLGYPYVLPAPIGGSEFPDKELYIRWMELVAFFPSMHFSISPWQFDFDTVEIAQKFVSIHEEEVTPLVLQISRSVVMGPTAARYAPIIRPLWWHYPNDVMAQTIDDEFLIGDVMLVAPVMEQGARARTVYFPGGGEWRDERDGATYVGGETRNIPVALDEVAYFTRV
ncbi:KIAA1161 [Branchiostoma lanceolatum]|uniref:KIAA1161 protein n=1 Tax=Branchiostoma lanceolatum TaxID=7740 RepID=A0A8J9ZC09_BRALA|nr:KIAA1161 [Branchiostoma lanceolatum]